MVNLKLRLIFIALLLAVAIAIFWPALPVHSNNSQAGPPPSQSANTGAAVAAPNETLAIINGMLLDGTGAAPIPNGVVVVEDNRIVAAGPAAEVGLPVNAQVLDAANGTIMPGIINAHVHNTHTPGTRQRFLTQGVTATCDLATALTDMPQFDEAFTNQNQPAARGFNSGPMITAPGGYPSSYGFRWEYEIAMPGDAQVAVLNLASLGADMIKVALEPWQPQEPWPVLNPEQLQAVVETAHHYNLPVRAHVQQASVLDIALQAGVDVIEHTPLPFQEELKLQQLQPGETLTLADYPELESQLRRMVEQDITLVPTLSAGACATHNLPGLETEARRTMCEFQFEIVGRFHQLGGVVALGNDYGNPGVERGMPLREMELLLEAGLNPMAVIEAGTRHAAQVCGHGNELGTLEQGKLADIIIVDGNPLEDMKALDRVKWVIQDGQVVGASGEL